MKRNYNLTNSIFRYFSGLFLLIWSIDLQAQTIDEVGYLTPPITDEVIFYAQIKALNSNGGGKIDAVFALSEGPKGAYADYSTLLRFNNIQSIPNLDAYNNGYVRSGNVPVAFNKYYHCWFVINVPTSTYSVYVQAEDAASPVAVLNNGIFRKSGVNALLYWKTTHYAANSTNTLDLINTGLVSSIGEKATDAIIQSTAYGELDQENFQINHIPQVAVNTFISGLDFPETATLKLLDASQNEISLSSTTTLPNNSTLQVIGLETASYSLSTYEANDENKVLQAFNGVISHTNKTIENLYNNLTVFQFISGLKVSDYASFELINLVTGKAETNLSDLVSIKHSVRVTAENGSVANYSIETGNEALASKVISDRTGSIDGFYNSFTELSGHVELDVKDAENPFAGSIVNITSDDVWLYFKTTRPQTVNDNWLPYLRINGAEAKVDNNIRVSAYGEGTVVISHSSSFQPLTVYSDANLGGTSKALSIYTFHKDTQLGALADNVESFVLKKGYMASFSANSGGTGASKVYIADKEDLIINSLPTDLTNTVSFIRVVPWRWVSKKSFADGSYDKNAILGSTWRYDWNNAAESSLNIEYVPMRHNPNWNSYENIWNKKNATHALHFNEPDNSVDDGYSTVENAIAQWPNMLASGLRVGTPAPTDGGSAWVLDFVNQCKAKNYRVDFLAIHFYRGGQSTTQFYNFLKYLYDQTGLPIWVTEWNNGANWTCCLPSYESQASTINDWVDMLEAAPFVERYALYGAVQAERQMFYSGTLDLTPAGKVYQSKSSGQAYSSSSEAYNMQPFPADEATEINLDSKLFWTPKPANSGQVIYFGDSYPPAYAAHLPADANSFEIPEMDINKTYYWRVDQFEGNTKVSGPELEFSTLAFQKANTPSPANGETGVSIRTGMSWTSDPNKEELHKLYIGESLAEMQLEATLLDGLTTYDRSSIQEPLSGMTTYYWRVDEHVTLPNGTEQVITGDIWYFQTALVLDADKLPDFTVYPNPVTDFLKIKGAGNEEVIVFDLLGQQVAKGRTKETLDLRKLNKGVYVLQIAGKPSVKIVKE